MKKKPTFLFAIVTAALAACSTGDSPILKQARTMQEGMMKNCQTLDSTIGIQISELEANLIEMSQDTTLNSDTAKKNSYIVIKEKYNRLLDYKTKIDNFRSSVKLLPTPEQIAQGADNPFGQDAKDEDVLTSIRSAGATFSTLQADIQSEIK
jgi:hypothetical protein